MAVYTQVSRGDLAGFLAHYDLGDVREFRPIPEGIENTNYFLETAKGRFVLTLYESRVRESDLPFFLALMAHLSRKSPIFSAPILGRDAKPLRRLNAKPAALLKFLDGDWPRNPDKTHCAKAGEALAKCHLAAGHFPQTRANDLSLAGWARLIEATRSRADEVQPGLAALIAGEFDYLHAHWPDDLPRGTIHADLFPDNVLFQNGEVSGVIDFYFACTDFYAYDLAIALLAWCFAPEFDPEKAKALAFAYRAMVPMSGRETAALPVLARGAALRFLLTRLYDRLFPQTPALVHPKDPGEYVAKLEFLRANPRALKL